MRKIERRTLKTMLDLERDLALLEVLGPQHYRSFHLPGAFNIPGDDNAFDEKVRAAVSDPHQPVVVYGWDENCTASPKAARRLESLGYTEVMEYAAGKKDWKEAGLPIEMPRSDADRR